MLEVFLVFLKLGLTSFGGPVAHLSYFRAELVAKRKWLDEEHYAGMIALSQILPGPSSSQVGILLGWHRAKLGGAIAAFVGFTLPSAVLMLAFAYSVSAFALGDHPLLHGLKIVAVAIVADAVIGMARTLAPDFRRLCFVLSGAVLALMLPGIAGQLSAIVFSAIIGFLVLDPSPLGAGEAPQSLNRRWAVMAFALFLILLVSLAFAANASGDPVLRLFDAFYRTGSLVFGGGHVVLPLLQQETVTTGWVGQEAFVSGYGAAQALPGPLFAFAAFLGAQSAMGPGGIAGGLIALLAIYLPSFLLLAGATPVWNLIRGNGRAAAAMRGVNAGVVGLLAAAFIDPVMATGILSFADAAMALLLFLAIVSRRIPILAVVVAGAMTAWLLSYL